MRKYISYLCHVPKKCHLNIEATKYFIQRLTENTAMLVFVNSNRIRREIV